TPAGVAVAVSLADVVQHHGQVEHLRALDLVHHLREQRAALAMLSGTEMLELHDGSQRVLVDGVDVIEVADHHRAELAELGQERAERADVVHYAQGLVNPLPPPQDLEKRLDDRGQRAPGLDDGGRAGEELSRSAADLDAM